MAEAKHEWRKHEKALYVPKQAPVQLEVPEFKYIVLEGVGNPNNEEFSDAIGVLYSVSYGVRMLPKKGITPEGYFEYTVYPLEALWKQVEEKEEFDKNNLQYRIMMRQPDFVTEELLAQVLEIVAKKKPHDRLTEVKLESIQDGDCVQALHVGSYDDEPATFAKLDEFCVANGMERANEWHREIYLSDARKTEPKKLKTVLRFQVKNK
ncbi:MAG: GyrI-like domain-containing protein [Ruminococcus bromii]|nr:GyrI-like domain-containing protein [Ruminococcus bromii]